MAGKYGRPVRRSRSRRMFTRGAKRVHPKNTATVSMRGGTRL